MPQVIAKPEIQKVDERLASRWWRLNNLYYIIDEHGEKVVFKPEDNNVQKELFENLWYLNIILKSRQHGVTTFFCIFFLDACLFGNNIRAGIIAHNQEDAKSFFKDKIKFAYDNIRYPAIKEAITAKTDSAGELEFSNNSAIRVGTSLRSSTMQYLLISEYGKLCAKYPDKALEVKTGALNTVHAGQFIVIESTAEGREGHYFQLCEIARNMQREDKKLTKMDYKYFFFGWDRRPNYRLSLEDTEMVIIPSEMDGYFNEVSLKEGIKLDSAQKAWYVKKYAIQQDEMKREFPCTHDEAFEAAIQGAYYSVQMAKMREDGRLRAVPHNPSALVHTAWDLGINDETAIWFYQEDDSWINIIDYYQNSGEALDHYAKVLQERGYLYGSHFAPHDVGKRDLISGRTRLERALELGIRFERIERAADVVEDINEVRRGFYRFRIDETKCIEGIKALDNYRKEWDERNGCFKPRPMRNKATHGADALRTLTHGVLNMAAIPDIVVPYNPLPNSPNGWMAN